MSPPLAPRALLHLAELEQAIDRIASSYAGPEEINNLESAALPNRRAVIVAHDHLVQAIYLGFYSLRALSRANLRFAVSECIHPAYEILVDQIERAVTYEERALPEVEHKPQVWAEQVVLKLLAELPAMRRVLATDVQAAFEGDPAAKSIEEIVFSYPAIRAITTHRVAHLLYLAGVPMIPRIMSEYAHGETGIDIHAGARIGERFFIDHGTGVVIGETAVIGNNVKIYQGVTLGAHSARRSEHCGPLARQRHPTLEDDVTIYSGATVLGGDTIIGRGSVIGGNVWLDRSVPPGTKIFGRPRES